MAFSIFAPENIKSDFHLFYASSQSYLPEASPSLGAFPAGAL